MRKMTNGLFLAVIIAGITAATSCQKEEMNNDWKPQVRGYVNSMPQDMALRKTWDIVMADAMGGAVGAWLCSPGGPGGVIGGAIGGAAIASYSSWWRVGQPPYNPKPDPVITNNPYRNVGEIHNLICLDGANNPIYAVSNDNLVDSSFSTLLDYHMQNNQVSSPLNFQDLNNLSAEILTNRKITINDPDLIFLMEEFQRGLSKCDSRESGLEYIEGFENLVMDLPIEERTKSSVLVALSIAANSTNLWM